MELKQETPAEVSTSNVVKRTKRRKVDEVQQQQMIARKASEQ
jgi:hypothetical protein